MIKELILILCKLVLILMNIPLYLTLLFISLIPVIIKGDVTDCRDVTDSFIETVEHIKRIGKTSCNVSY